MHSIRETTLDTKYRAGARAEIAAGLGIAALAASWYGAGLVLGLAALTVSIMAMFRPEAGGGLKRWHRVCVVTGLIAGLLAAVASAVVVSRVGAMAWQSWQRSKPSPEQRELVQQCEGLGSDACREVALATWAAGRQVDAEYLLAVLTRRFPRDQRLVFFRAACMRSRFQRNRAGLFFMWVVHLGAWTPEGLCARYVLRMDAGKNVDEHFGHLQSLVTRNADNPLLLWMLAVQCRTHDRVDLGIECYEQLLQMISPGPSLLHQTYANLLDEAGRYEEALKHRLMAVQMEPRGWTYYSLGNTYTYLERYDDAERAYEEGSRIAPASADVVASWGWSLWKQGRRDEAIDKYRRAVELDPDSAQHEQDLGRCLHAVGREIEAIDAYTRAISNGYRLAFTFVGNAYRDGRGRPQNYLEAMRTYLEGVKAGEPESYAAVGWMHYCGFGVPKDWTNAAAWYLQGANAGDMYGMQLYGYACHHGEGVPVNYTEAMKWYLAAAELGHSNAMANIGLLYQRGHGVPRDLDAAIAWYRRAAEAGHVWAMTRLGFIYSSLRNYAAAVEWYERAAMLDDAESQNSLAWIHATCVEAQMRNPTRAVEWAEKAVKSQPDNGSWLDTLAAAYARDGRFAHALDAQRKAIEVETRRDPHSPNLAPFRARLALYENGQLYEE